MSDGPMGGEWPPRSSDAFPRIARLPAYVFAQVNAEKRERLEAGEDIIDLGMGNPDLPTPPHIVEELVDPRRSGQAPPLQRLAGIYGLREAIADHYAAATTWSWTRRRRWW